MTPSPADGRAAADLADPASLPSVDAGASAKIQLAVDRIFDLSRLHEIAIVVAPSDVKALETRTNVRVRCTFTFDGVTLTNVGIRQGGASYHPPLNLKQKISLSVKFDEFVPKQSLDGLDKIFLKGQTQDLSRVNEHMAYEIYRRAGIPASQTAYAVVTINGYVNGIYMLREAINQQFLARNYGKGFEQGNLYEGTYFAGEFVDSPTKIELKDEVEEMRKRDDLVALSAAIRNTAGATFVTEVSRRLNMDKYITEFAVAAVIGDMDSYHFNHNNYYLYDNPHDSRFVMIPHGSDQSFWAEKLDASGFRLKSAIQNPDPTVFEALGKLSLKVRGNPELDARFRAEVMRVGSAPVWDIDALLARIAHVAKLFSAAPNAPTVKADVDSFNKWRPTVESFVRMYGLSRR